MRSATRACLVLFVLVVSSSAARADDAVLQWNKIAVETLTTQTPALSPFHQARFASIIQLAVFEAVNAITGKYESYLGSPVAPDATPVNAPFGASAEAAAVAAAHAVLVKYFPGNAPGPTGLDAKRGASLAAIPDGPGTSEADGVAVGIAAATRVTDERAGDGSSPSTFYTPAPLQNGVWAITPGCPTDLSGNPLGGVLLNWRDVRPFGVVKPAVGHWSEPFMPGPPPALTSNQYAKDYNEVKAKGALVVPGRPEDREVVARFYGATSPTFLFLTAARQLAEAQGDSLAENARNLALISIATNDSLVASFATKYHYDFWRPVTAIRAGATTPDGNNKTEGDINFATFLPTPCFPGYPSNHASGSNGAAETMRRIYGAAGHSITLSATIPVIGATTLTYTSLKQMCDDVDDARIYGGMHYRFDQEAGVRLGNDVATYVYKNNLQPLHGSN
jgi:hypothetical protein